MCSFNLVKDIKNHRYATCQDIGNSRREISQVREERESYRLHVNAVHNYMGCVLLFGVYQGRQNQLSVLPRFSHSLYGQVEIFQKSLYKYHTDK